jgi:LysM repeat protein
MKKLQTNLVDIFTMPVILGGALVIAVIVCGILLFTQKQGPPPEFMEIKDRLSEVERRLGDAEKKNRMDEGAMARLDAAEEKIRAFTEQFGPVQAVPAEMESVRTSVGHMDSRLGNIEKKLAELETRQKTVPRSTSKAVSPPAATPGVTQTPKPVPPAPKPGVAQTPKPVPPAPKPSVAQTHMVGVGDTLFSIAKQYGLTVAELKRLNNLTPDALIQPGQKLVVGK